MGTGMGSLTSHPALYKLSQLGQGGRHHTSLGEPMQTHRSMSVTVIQLPNDEAVAWVAVSDRTDGAKKTRHFEFNLGTLEDVLDATMWSQMVAAKICDSL